MQGVEWVDNILQGQPEVTWTPRCEQALDQLAG